MSLRSSSLLLMIVCLTVPIVSAATNRTAARSALDYVKQVSQGPCEPGPRNTLSLDFEHTQWNAYATIATKTANLLTKLIIQGNGKLSSVDEYFLYGLCRNNVQGDELVFGSAIAFEAGVFADYTQFAPYAHMVGENTATAFDLSLNYDYTADNVEWYATLRDRDWRNQMITKDNVTYRNGITYEYSQPQARIEDGHWTYPYFDCGGGNVWMVTYSAPIFAFSSVDNKPVFRGLATIDIELTNVDINQCDESVTGGQDASRVDLFRGTHLCQDTTTCRPIKGLGFKSGAYECVCVDGFHFPDSSSEKTSFNGAAMEANFTALVTSSNRCVPKTLSTSSSMFVHSKVILNVFITICSIIIIYV